jgi:hypothetical protein
VDRRNLSTIRFSVVWLALVALLACACGGSSGTPATPGGTAAQSTATAAPTSHTGGLPSDECSVVTPADVEAAFGGTASPGKIDENGHCSFEVSGDIHAGPNAGTVPGFVTVSFGDKHTSLATAQLVFGKDIVKVDGLGTDAWYGLTAVHAQIAAGELVVGALWVGQFDKGILMADTISLAKIILPRL